MLCEVNIFDSCALWSYAVSSLENDADNKNFHEAICPKSASSKDCSSILGRVYPLKNVKGTIVKKSAAILPMMARVDGSAELKIDIVWGGEDGVDVNIGASGEIHVDKRMYVEVEVSQKVSEDGLGEGKASVSARHE